MERITFLQNTIIELLEDTANYYKGTTNPLNVNVIIDKVNNHFQLLMQGWKGNDYIFQCFLHLDIIQGKIWIQWNDTEFPIEEDLLKMGVSNQEIVLGVKSPEYRKYTDFALA